MSDILSQEQIDALLASDSLGNDKGSPDGTEQSGANKYAALYGFFEYFCIQAGNVISAIISKQIDFKPRQPRKADFAAAGAGINAVVLSLDLAFKSGLEGDFYLIMAKKDVAMLSDLMIMGDGTTEYSEDHKDAIGEMFNQVMGAFCNAFGKEMGISITAGNVVVNEFDLENPSFTADSFDMAETVLSMEGSSRSKVFFLIPESLAGQIIKISKGMDSLTAGSGQVGLNMSEIDDLSRVTSFGPGDNGYQPESLSAADLKGSNTSIDMLLDIELDVSIELGRSLLSIKRVLELAPGSIVELDRMAGEPVDLLVNNKVVAKGEVVVIDESFGIRIVSLISAEERIKSLR